MHILELPVINDIKTISREIYAKGWGEANGGNISIRIPYEEFEPWKNELHDGAEQNLPFSVPGLAGEYFLVTGTGVFFRNIPQSPEQSLGIVRINSRGNAYRTVWGYSGGGRPTSEMFSHLLSHEVRKKASDGRDRYILHTHATNLIALSFVLPLDTVVFSRELWEMMSECMLLFPEGIGVLDWMAPGRLELGKATANLLKTHRLVLWPHHGILGTGESMDQTFGLLETADKAAEMLLKVLAAGGKRQTVSARQLKELATAFKVIPLAEAL